MEKLQTLIDQANDEIKSQSEYIESDDCNMYCEYLQSGEFELNRDWDDELDDEIKEKLERLGLCPESLKNLLIESSELCYIGEMYHWRREIGSISIGETEFELSDEIQTGIKALTADEFTEFKRRIDGYIKDQASAYIYLNFDYSRWALRYNESLLAEKIDELLKTKKAPKYLIADRSEKPKQAQATKAPKTKASATGQVISINTGKAKPLTEKQKRAEISAKLFGTFGKVIEFKKRA